ncbi:MAG: HPr family phosphocarrier protein [Proteobacteria bacterium]|nr:HPr family phosphocarrier protein [Pseudomonadota bacterium]
MLTKKVTIVNKLGLHARAAAKFVSHASHYESEAYLIKGNDRANGKSIMSVMLLAASHGTELELQTTGKDEVEMMQDLEKLIQEKFGESE